MASVNRLSLPTPAPDASFPEHNEAIFDSKLINLATSVKHGLTARVTLPAHREDIGAMAHVACPSHFQIESQLMLLQRQAGVHAFSLMNELRDDACRARGITFIGDAAMRGALPPPTIDSVYPLAEIAATCDRVESAQQIGKIVVSMEG